MRFDEGDKLRKGHFLEIYDVVDGNRKEIVIFLGMKEDVTRVSVDFTNITYTGDIGATFLFGIGNKVSDGDYRMFGEMFLDECESCIQEGATVVVQQNSILRMASGLGNGSFVAGQCGKRRELGGSILLRHGRMFGGAWMGEMEHVFVQMGVGGRIEKGIGQ